MDHMEKCMGAIMSHMGIDMPKRQERHSIVTKYKGVYDQSSSSPSLVRELKQNHNGSGSSPGILMEELTSFDLL